MLACWRKSLLLSLYVLNDLSHKYSLKIQMPRFKSFPRNQLNRPIRTVYYVAWRLCYGAELTKNLLPDVYLMFIGMFHSE